MNASPDCNSEKNSIREKKEDETNDTSSHHIIHPSKSFHWIANCFNVHHKIPWSHSRPSSLQKSNCFMNNPFHMFLSGKYNANEKTSHLVLLSHEVMKCIRSFLQFRHEQHLPKDGHGKGLISALPAIYKSCDDSSHITREFVSFHFERFYENYVQHDDPMIVFQNDTSVFKGNTEYFFSPGWFEVHFPYHCIKISGYSFRNGGGKRYALRKWKLEGKMNRNDPTWECIHAPSEDYCVRIQVDGGEYFSLHSISVPIMSRDKPFSAFRLTNLDSDLINEESSRPLFLSGFDLYGVIMEKDMDFPSSSRSFFSAS